MPSRRYTPMPSPPSSEGSVPRRPAQQFDTQTYDRSGTLVALENDPDFDRHSMDFIMVKNQPFAVSGRIPLDARSLTLFFRSQNNTSHSVDFPFDLEDGTTTAFEMLLETCKTFTRASQRRSSSSSLSSRSTSHHASHGPYVFPPHLSLSTTLDIGNHPILETIRSVLFPNLPTGHYLVAERASLEMAPQGSRSRALLVEETPPDRVATLVITLPIRFRGGVLVVSHPDDSLGVAERFKGRGGKPGALEWTAFLADCEYGLEAVDKGCKVSLSYNIRLRTFGPTGPDPQPLLSPNDRFLDAMTPLFTRAKNMKLGFFLSGDYSIFPADVIADTIVPQLKGGDAVLFHAVKLYGFDVELRYTAGGFIWAAPHTIQLIPGDAPLSPTSSSSSSSLHDQPTGRRRALSISLSQKDVAPHLRSSLDEEERMRNTPPESQHSVKNQVLASGAQKLVDAGVLALTAPSRRVQGPVTRLPVPFIANGAMNRLWVNVLMVVSRA